MPPSPAPRTLADVVIANPLVVGNARFTVVTPECVRLEYSEKGEFVDAPSMFAVGRDKRVAAPLNVERHSDGHIVVHTGRMRINYTPNGEAFNDTNLNIVIDAGDREITWTPACEQTQNLGGTIATLDQVKGPVDLGEGLLSRDGWYLLDDSRGHLLVDGWVAARPADAGTDWYLFGYGSDYRAAFRALTAIGGQVPMPRKAVLGSWYSRWWHYTTEDYKQIVREYEEHDFPLDVMVMDMEWHTGPWTGWSWNYELLPNPPALLAWFHEQGLTVTMNVHPAEGVAPTETMYADFMRELGEDPASGKTVTFDAGNRKYMEALFKHTHHPREEEGCDFWWLDWQQYRDVKSLPGLTNLSWLNKVYFDDSMRKGKRGLQFSRWGGWGDHRHPIHFSGDADTGWAMLGFEVPFTSTAGNVGCHFWSHDIGGHFGERNEEPYTRWVQFAATTAAMRLHSGIIPYLDRRPWMWPQWATDSMRHAFHWRAKYMPYIYSAVRESHETGLPLNRPMYIDWPREADAYRAPQQYMFGPELLVAPIASRGYGEGRVASQLVWFPAGAWRNMFTGERFVGPTWRLVCADLTEWPMFVREGVPIPSQPYSARPTSAKLEKLVVEVWAGEDNGMRRHFAFYEDDGDSQAYKTGDRTITWLRTFNQHMHTAVLLNGTVETGDKRGEFNELQTDRAYEIRFQGVDTVHQVHHDGRPLQLKRDDTDGAAIIELPKPASAALVACLADQLDPAVFAHRAFARRLSGIVGEAAAANKTSADLAALIDDASRNNPAILPGLIALAGVAVVENETHYPHVGTLSRVVRNPGSIIDANGLAVAWRRIITPIGVPGAVGEITTVEASFDALEGIAPLAPVEWSARPLGFFEHARVERSLVFRINGAHYGFTQPIGEEHGRIARWMVSPKYPFDFKTPIDQVHHEPEAMPLADLKAALRGRVPADWVETTSNHEGVVELLKVHDAQYCVAYALGGVELDEARDVTLGFKSDDGIEVWLNGAKIHSVHAQRGMNHDWEDVAVRFAKGLNVLLVKVSQAEVDWGFVVRVR